MPAYKSYMQKISSGSGILGFSVWSASVVSNIQLLYFLSEKIQQPLI